MDNSNNSVRREVGARKTNLARRTASFLARTGIKPNGISMLSIFFAAGAGICLFFSSGFTEMQKIGIFIVAAILIQLRLLCKLFDGMVALEGGLKTKSGEIFNDLPDRFSDPLILVGAGYSISHLNFGVELGWLSSILAVLTAYVRVLAGSTGAKQSFAGPMAKQHRMAVMTIALIVASIDIKGVWSEYIIMIALGTIILGSIITIFRRTALAVHELESG